MKLATVLLALTALLAVGFVSGCDACCKKEEPKMEGPSCPPLAEPACPTETVAPACPTSSGCTLRMEGTVKQEGNCPTSCNDMTSSGVKCLRCDIYEPGVSGK